jgi:hypothetical protein
MAQQQAYQFAARKAGGPQDAYLDFHINAKSSKEPSRFVAPAQNLPTPG